MLHRSGNFVIFEIFEIYYITSIGSEAPVDLTRFYTNITQTMEVLVQVGGQSMKIACGEGTQVGTDMGLLHFCASLLLHCLVYRCYVLWFMVEYTLDFLVLKRSTQRE